MPSVVLSLIKIVVSAAYIYNAHIVVGILDLARKIVGQQDEYNQA